VKLEFHPEAEQEFLEAISYYEAEVPGLGERFEAEMQRASALLLEYPEIGPLADAELRKLVLHRFPYYVLYALSAETVRIVAVAHEKRRPGYWLGRMTP
jgi:toxin ParE1/3/4